MVVATTRGHPYWHLTGLVLQPTGTKHGQFRRLGMIDNRPVEDMGSFMETAMDSTLLEGEFYLEAARDKGFTIELI